MSVKMLDAIADLSRYTRELQAELKAEKAAHAETKEMSEERRLGYLDACRSWRHEKDAKEEARSLAGKYLRVLKSDDRHGYPSELPWGPK